MPNEKLYTAKQAAEAVLAKAADLLEKSSKNTPWDQRPMHVGVHNASDHATGGKSFAGERTRSAKGNAGLKHVTDVENAEAKDSHKQVLSALKAQPKPNLGKAESEAKTGAQHEAEGKERQAKIAQKEIATNKGPRAGDMGASLAAKKPALGKAEDGMKVAPSTDKNAPAEKDQSGPNGVKPVTNPATPNDKINGNPAPGAFPQNQVKYAAEGGTKGHIQLAKFVGAIEQKRKAKVVAPAATAPAAAMNKSELPLKKAEIGKTTSGKAVHSSFGAQAHKDFSPADHYDALSIRHASGLTGKTTSHMRDSEKHGKAAGLKGSDYSAKRSEIESHGKKLLGK